MSKAIGIMGCGWLGLPLAVQLVANGHRVKGTTTTVEKKTILAKEAIEPFSIKLTEKAVLGDFKSFGEELDILIINIPPKLRRPPFENYVGKMKALLTAMAHTPIKKVVFVGSTSVYGSVTGDITEKTTPKPNTEAARQLLQAETLFRGNPNFDTTTIRFAGLIGGGRHPVHQLSKKKQVTNGDELVNLIHLKDCIRLIKKIVADDLWNTTVNGAYPYHPTKREYYTQEAIIRGLPIPNFVRKSGESIKKSIKSNIFPTYLQYPITSSF